MKDSDRNWGLSPRRFLRELIEPSKPEEFKKIIEDTYSGINWGAVIRRYECDPFSPERQAQNDFITSTASELYYLHIIICQLRSGKLASHNYHELDTILRKIAELSQKWEEKGFFKEHPDIQTTEEVPSPEQTRIKREGLIRELQSLRAELVECKKLASVYSSNAKFRNDDTVIQFFIHALELNFYHNDLEQYDHDPRFVRAMRSFIDRKRVELEAKGILSQGDAARTKYLEPLKNMNIGPVLQSIEFIGFDEAEGLFTQELANQLKLSLASSLPPAMLRGIKSITLTIKDKDFDKDPDRPPNEEIAGRAKPEYDDEGNLILTRIEIYKDSMQRIKTRIESYPEFKQYAENMVIMNFIETVFHEIAHSVHDMMTFDEMRKWDQITDKYPTNVTWYVKRSGEERKLRLKNNDGELREIPEGNQIARARQKREDFCETFVLYCTYPARLQVVSPERYAFMHEFFLNYTKDEFKNAFAREKEQQIADRKAIWRANGKTEEDIRQQFTY
jgi:hypothetical protein